MVVVEGSGSASARHRRHDLEGHAGLDRHGVEHLHHVQDAGGAAGVLRARHWARWGGRPDDEDGKKKPEEPTTEICVTRG